MVRGEGGRGRVVESVCFGGACAPAKGDVMVCPPDRLLVHLEFPAPHALALGGASDGLRMRDLARAELVPMALACVGAAERGTTAAVAHIWILQGQSARMRSESEARTDVAVVDPRMPNEIVSPRKDPITLLAPPAAPRLPLRADVRRANRRRARAAAVAGQGRVERERRRETGIAAVRGRARGLPRRKLRNETDVGSDVTAVIVLWLVVLEVDVRCGGRWVRKKESGRRRGVVRDAVWVPRPGERDGVRVGVPVGRDARVCGIMHARRRGCRGKVCVAPIDLWRIQGVRHQRFSGRRKALRGVGRGVHGSNREWIRNVSHFSSARPG